MRSIPGFRRSSPFEAAATALGVTTAALAAVAFTFAWANRNAPIDDVIRDAPKWFTTQNAVSAIVFLVPGWYLAVSTPRNIFGWVLLAAALGHAAAGAAFGYLVRSEVVGAHLPAVRWVLPVIGPGAGLEVPVVTAISVLYPDGRLPRRSIAIPGLLFTALGAIGVATAALDPFNNLAVDPASHLAQVHNPLGTQFFARFDYGGALWMGSSGIGGTVILIVRWALARGDARRVLGWLAAATVAVVPFAPLALLGGEWFLLSVQAPTILVVAALVAATLRYRVFGIEMVVRRAYVYAALLFAVVASYGAVIGAITLFAGRTSASSAAFAAVISAFALAPARTRIERLINRFLFGERDEPYAVLSHVAARLEAAASEDTLLPEFAAHVSQALRVPFVALAYGQPGDRRSIAHGEPTTDGEQFALNRQGAEIGTLFVAHRSGEREFAPAERNLLANLARQASAAVANIALAEDLQRSRERIVSAREEERRRLRRDLHDGLGPVLTGAAMMIDAGRNLVPRDPAAADQHLVDARAQVKSAIDDVRRLVYALRPPALDELGLVGALREQTQRGALNVTIAAEGPLEELPAAVEVAAFRIISEAVTNAARHSDATACTVGISVNGALNIDVRDNGRAADIWRPGVGIVSMRERAAELGGVCHAGPSEDGHGHVHAVIPLGGQT